ADRNVAQPVTPGGHALRPIEVDRRDQERAVERGERVPEPAGRQGLAHVALQRDEREEPRGQVALGAREHVGDRAGHPGHGVLADRPEQPAEPARRVTERVRGVDGATAEIQRVLPILVDDAIDLRGPDSVGQQGGDDGPRAATHVDVEAAASGELLLHRRDDADLVHAADDAPARQGQRVARPALRSEAPDEAIHEIHLTPYYNNPIQTPCQTGIYPETPYFPREAPATGVPAWHPTGQHVASRWTAPEHPATQGERYPASVSSRPPTGKSLRFPPPPPPSPSSPER